MNRAYALLNIKSIDEDKRSFEGIATSIEPDRMGDVVEPRGAKFKLPLPLLWQHRTDQPIGNVISAKVSDTEITIRAQVAKIDEPPALKAELDRAWSLIKSGLVRGLSIGFRDLESAYDKATGGIHFLRSEILELSAVTIPANQGATITAIKSIDTTQRAALGTSSRGSTLPGATGATAVPTGKSTMKTLTQLQERRDQVATRHKELSEGCNNDFDQLSAEESSEFDGLSTELRSLDVNIGRMQAVELAAKGATPVSQSAGTDPDVAMRARAGRIEVKQGPKLEKGIAFAQYLRMQGIAAKDKVSPLVVAQKWQKSFPSLVDPRVVSMIKADVEGATVSGTPTAGNWGMELIGTEVGPVADFVEYLRPMTILGKFGQNGIPALRRVPFRAPLVGMTSGGTGYWVAEGESKPVTKFEFSRTHMDPLKVAALAVASMEWLRDSSPSGDVILRDALVSALRETLDMDFIDPANNGTAGSKPASITYNISAPNSSGTDADGVRADIKAMFGVFTAANNPMSSAVFIVPTSVALTLEMMLNAMGQREFPDVSLRGGTLFGIPVIVSDYVPSVTAGARMYLVNAQDIYYADDGGFQVDTSMHASIEMSTAPAGDINTPTAPTQKVVSMYQTNSVAYRAERTIDWMRRRDSAVAAIDTINYA